MIIPANHLTGAKKWVLSTSGLGGTNKQNQGATKVEHKQLKQQLQITTVQSCQINALKN